MTTYSHEMPRRCNICHRIMFTYHVDYNHYKKNHSSCRHTVEYHKLNDLKKTNWVENEP